MNFFFLDNCWAAVEITRDMKLTIWSEAIGVLTSVRIKTDSTTVHELVSTIKALPNFKGSGVDDIPAEFYKINPVLIA